MSFVLSMIEYRWSSLFIFSLMKRSPLSFDFSSIEKNLTSSFVSSGCQKSMIRLILVACPSYQASWLNESSKIMHLSYSKLTVSSPTRILAPSTPIKGK